MSETMQRIDEHMRVTLNITGMTCAACSSRIQKKLSKMEGVAEASVNLATEKANVLFDPSKVKVDDLMAAITEMGYGVGREKVSLSVTGMT